MNVKKHLYDSLMGFIMNLPPAEYNDTYRDLRLCKSLFDKAKATLKEDGHPTLEVYEATLISNIFIAEFKNTLTYADISRLFYNRRTAS